MNERLRCLFEEDIAMQDTIDDLDGLTDDTEDMIITAFEDRSENKESLFDDIKRDPEFEAAIDCLSKDDEDLIDTKTIDDLSDEEIDELFDDEDGLDDDLDF